MGSGKELVIEISRDGSEQHEMETEALCRETVNILYQYRALLKRPEKKLQDLFAKMIVHIVSLLVLAVFMAAVCILFISRKGFDPVMILALVVAPAAVVLEGIILHNMNRMKKQLMNARGAAVITFDDRGAEHKTEEQTIRLSWESVAFVRSFRSSVCILSKETGIVIGVGKRYEKEILAWLAANRPDVRVIA